MAILAFITTITVAQLIAHAIGDYWLQSGWMATKKTEAWIPAIVHGLVYSLPFVVIFSPSLAAWAVIVGTHIIIDHYRLARHMVWARNWLSPQRPKPWKECNKTGFDSETPDYLAVWLMIITDNLLHILINGWALSVL